jgi:uncharacterized protein (TIGR02598 family)
MKPHHPRPRSPAGFSLVEASLAMGIAAVGIISLIGLVPTSLDTLRESASDVAEAKIIQAVAADYQMSDWGERSEKMKPDDKEYYFDQRGLEVPRGTFGHQFTAKATVEVDNPQMTGDPTGNIYLRRVVVKITDRLNDSGAFTNPGKHRTHGVMVGHVDQTGKLLTPKKS